MEPEHGALEDYFPLQVFRFHVNLSGFTLIYADTAYVVNGADKPALWTGPLNSPTQTWTILPTTPTETLDIHP